MSIENANSLTNTTDVSTKAPDSIPDSLSGREEKPTWINEALSEDPENALAHRLSELLDEANSALTGARITGRLLNKRLHALEERYQWLKANWHRIDVFMGGHCMIDVDDDNVGQEREYESLDALVSAEIPKEEKV